MSRTIKFRAWNWLEKRWFHYSLHELIFQGVLAPNDFENWCESTGLKDKNGKEIYEGDILTQRYPGVWEVVYKAPKFYMKRHENPVDDSFPWRKKDNLPVEIIGNIHENPELLSN